MTLSDISIRNPVFAWMIMIGLIAFGAIGFSRMGISQLPDVDFPVVTVSVSWTGAPPETMETAVADVIEDAVMSVEGIRTVSSTSQEGSTNITIEFELNRNIDVALQEVQSKLAQAQKVLPTDIDPPIVTKSNPEDNPILWAALSGGDLRTMVRFIRDHLKDNITTVSGVGDVTLGGYVDPNMRIWLKTDEMVKREISVDDIIAAINNQHTLAPSGYMDNGSKEKNIRVLSEARSPEQFHDLIIPSRNGQPIWNPIRLGDVARIEEGIADVRRISRMNGDRAVGLGVIKQRGSNAVSVGEGIKAKVDSLKGFLPDGMKLNVVFDSTKFIKQSTAELLLTLSLSVLLTSLVCWLFLGSWSSALNVILAIPTSLIGAFIFLYFCGFTLNTFTLLALSLSIGIVVDDAIMVLENIVRRKEGGLSRVQAAIVGAREITTAATAASLAILAIFVPVIFMKGIIGKFFFQFGVAISVAVLLSLLEALTLAPMRCSQFLQTSHNSGIGAWMDRLMKNLEKLYHRILAWSLNHRWKVIWISTAVCALSFLLVTDVKKELLPPQDQSRFLASIQTPLGSSLEFTDSVFLKAEAIMKTRPELDNYYVAVGGFGGGIVNQGNMFVVMKEYGDRPIAAPFTHRPTQQEFMQFFREEVKKIPGIMRVGVIDLSLSGFSAGRGGSYPIQFSVQGPQWDRLGEFAKTIMDRMNSSGLMADIDSDYKLGMPEIKVLPNRKEAGDRGVMVTNIANTITAAVGSLRVSKYTDDSGHRNDIRIKLDSAYNKTPEDISRIRVRNNRGEMVPLSQVVTLDETPTLLTISRYNRERAITITANIAPGKSQADALAFIQKTGKEILPDSYRVVVSGSSQAFQESIQSLLTAFILGLFIAYMILGAQFNSFIHPITVLLAIPFSLTGAFIALRLTGISLNVYSGIGLLLLAGIVKKNSILLVDFTNTKRLEGLEVGRALLEACPLRLRPILMTSVATVAGAIPAACSIGSGGETTRPMAIVVIGGVIFSTLLTLVVIPCAYSLMSRLESKTSRRELKEALRALAG
jgi:multidrug efflux pump